MTREELARLNKLVAEHDKLVELVAEAKEATSVRLVFNMANETSVEHLISLDKALAFLLATVDQIRSQTSALGLYEPLPVKEPAR